jgi:hypothetical protein
LPQLPARFTRAITEGQTNNSFGFTFKRNPNPDHMVFVVNERPEFIDLEGWSDFERGDGFSQRLDVFFDRVERA